MPNFENLEMIARASGVLEGRGEKLPSAAVKALAREVLSRLETSNRPAIFEPEPDEQAIMTLCDALLSSGNDAAMDLVQQAQKAGMSADMLHLGYIAKAARLLGERWDNDEVSFVDVILGAGRIYAILRHLREVFISARVLGDDAKRAAFASVPGEIHTLGVTMAADYMRRRGWQIDLKAGLTHSELVGEIARVRYPVIGLSASSKTMIFPLARLIVALRVSNPEAWIMVSGKIVDQEPELAALIDADAVAADANAAETQIEAHMSLLAAAVAREGVSP